MSDENNFQPIGDPEPMLEFEWRKILKGIGTVIALSIGGIVTLALFTTTTRVRGASRSAKLNWQQRQQEIIQAIQSSDELEKNKLGRTTAPPPDVPDHEAAQ